MVGSHGGAFDPACDSRSFARARSARSLRMTTPRGFGGKKGEGGFSLSPRAARSGVILSAAGAKDLLLRAPHRRRGVRCGGIGRFTVNVAPCPTVERTSTPPPNMSRVHWLT